MKFSVLMSVYIKENPDYLLECLKSVTNQSLMPNEIVLVKDGPLNSQLEDVIDSFKFNNPKLFKIVSLDSNVGLGIALAKGVEACSYDLIARMDTDDIAREDRFEIQINEFINDPSLSILGSNIIEFEQDINNILAKKKVPKHHDEILKYAKFRNPFNHMTIMYKKESVLKSGNYRKVYKMGYEDYELWIRMLSHGCKSKNIDDYLVYARTGKSMYKRRGNKERLLTGVYFRKQELDMGFINIMEFLYLIFASFIFAFVPNRLRGRVYTNLLRNK